MGVIAYRFVAQLFDATMKESGLSDRRRHVTWHVEFEIRVVRRDATAVR